jgi:outer membrane cobalamin receptor
VGQTSQARRRRRRLRLSVGSLALLLAAGAGADPAADAGEASPLETLLVTASHGPLPPASAPGGVEVVSGDELRRAHYDGVLEALRHRPGLHADQPGGRGSRGSVYTRGLDPNHTKVLVDGVALNDPTNARGGSFDLSTLDNLDSIERIEIVRGPASAVWGSDALAGAVHVITRDGRGPDALRMGVSGGRYGYLQGFASARGQRGPFDAVASGSYVDEGMPDENGDYRGGSVYGSLGADLSRGARLRGTLFYNDADLEAFPEYSGGPELAEIRAFEERRVRSVAAGLALTQQPLGWLDYALTGSLYRRRERRRSPGVAPALDDQCGIPAEPGSRDELRRGALALRATARAPGDVALSAGGDVTWEAGRSRGEFVSLGPPTDDCLSGTTDFRLDRTVGGPFAEVHWRSGFGLALLAGVRADFSGEEGAVVTPRVRGSYALPGLPLVVDASWGEGFKLPSLFSLGNPTAGNPALRAEHSRGWDVGLHYAHPSGWVEASASYFEIRVRDLIDLNADSFRLENLDEARSRGVEWEGRLTPFAALELRGYASYADTIDTDTHERLRERPRWRGGFALDWRPVTAVSLRVEGLFVGGVLDASAPTGRGTLVKLDAYERVDLSLSWSPRPWLEVHLAVDNLLDAHYREAVGYPAPGIRPRAGVALRL